MSTDQEPVNRLRQLAYVAVIVTALALVAALGVLGWRTMQKDRADDSARAAASASASASAAAELRRRGSYVVVKVLPWEPPKNPTQTSENCSRMRDIAGPFEGNLLPVDDADGSDVRPERAEDCGLVVDRSRTIVQ